MPTMPSLQHHQDTDTIETVKLMIEALLNIPPNQQWLSCHGVQLTAGTVADLGITESTTLILIRKAGRAWSSHLRIERHSRQPSSCHGAVVAQSHLRPPCRTRGPAARFCR